ncbi:MAG: hypothetical protein IKT10_00305 [Clostridiales bacterium]|nr:hypothetical protein [Clostridiales bacterium]
MSKLFEDSRFSPTSPLRYFLLLFPFAIATILGVLTMKSQDTASCLLWAFFLLLIGLVTLPLATKIWEKFSSGGFFLSQALGLVLTSLVLWTLTHLKVFRLNILCIFLSALIVAAICYAPKTFRKSLTDKLTSKGFVEAVVVEETVFLVIFFLMCYFKGFLPDINGQEKYMDYGFIMSMLRDDSLPAHDMWLSGYSINYYYFGQFIWAVVIKATGITPGVGYNLAMCSATAIPFAMSFSIGKFLIEAATERGFIDNKIIKYVAGFFTGCAVSLWGNSHSFFYDEKSIGNSLLHTFQSWGIEVGRTDSFFYPDSTRYIGWNPEWDLNGGDHTIHEFPFYSYIVGDLHAHVISMTIVLLITAIVLSAIASVKLPSQSEINIKGSLDNLSSGSSRFAPEFDSSITIHLILCAILLGCAQMTNYWDFLIYFIYCAMGYLIVNTIRSAKFATPAGIFVFIANVGGILLIYLSQGSNPLVLYILESILMVASFLFCIVSPSALPRTSFQMSFLFSFATLTALPFNLNFDMISNSLGKVHNRSPFYQLFILYGTHVIITVTFVVIVFALKNYRYISNAKAKKKSASESVIGDNEKFTNPIQEFFYKRNLIDIFVCGMVVVGLMMIAAPEIFYVRDIYTYGYLRSNTMFKFCFAAFIILSIAMIYSVIRLLWFVNKNGKYSSAFFAIAIVFIIMLFVPAHYTMVTLKQRCGEDLSPANYKGLDGTNYLTYHTSSIVNDNYAGNIVSYKLCADWFNKEIKGSHVICESYGDSYTDISIISAYTGNPTVFGWLTHEWLWRFHGIIDKDQDILVSDPANDVWALYITPRHNDIDTIYWSDSVEEVQTMIDKYQIEYIIMGDMERFHFGYDNSYVFSQLGERVFEYDTLTVYKVTPRT